jgi:cytochrome c oxidase subunit 2
VLHANEPGEYLGQCAEYCGLSHANMRFRVFALEPAEYEQWLEEQQEGPAVPFSEDAPPAPGAPPLAEGEEPPQVPAGPAQELIGKYACTNCHTLDNPAASTYGPNLTHLASRETFASGYFELNRENLIEWLLDAPSMIPMESEDCREEGAPGGPGITCVGMPSFTKDTPAGQPVMTRQDAEVLADYLLSLT